MGIARLVLVAAAAAGAAYYFKGRGPIDLPGLRQRLSLGGGMGGAQPAASPVGETMWTPSDPGAASGAGRPSPSV